jgi:hypothetical protein
MTMFSMKPKFNLAEFLAEPAKPNSSRKRSMAMPVREAKPVEEPEAAPVRAAAVKKKR